MQLLNQWCVILLNDQGGENPVTHEDVVIIEGAFGPFTHRDAIMFCNEYNKEHDGSPFHAMVRPLTLLRVKEPS